MTSMNFIPTAKGGKLDFHDYLWIPKSKRGGAVTKENIFCEVGEIHHIYTHGMKTLRTGAGGMLKLKLLRAR